MVNQLKIGMVGTGFMGRAHSNAYRRVNQFFDVAYEPVLKAVAARSKEKTEAFARRWGWERAEDDWRKLIDAPVIDEGRLGKIFHYRATYLQDWTISPKVPVGGAATWRLEKEVAGAGVSGDLSAHNIDTALWLNGSISRVFGMTEIFIRNRQRPDGTPASVEIDDVCTFLARFENGSNGTFEATRYARGRKNKNSFEINGERGSLYFDLENMHQLQYFNHDDPDHLQGWRTILVTGSEHPYMANWWVPGCVIGYEHTFINALADFLKALEKNERVRPDFRDALETQAVVEAVLESARAEKWVKPEKQS